MDFSFLFQPAFSGGGTYLDWVNSGVKWTMLVSILAWIIAFTLGSILGVLRTTNVTVLRAFAAGYVELFRNIPLLVQMFIWYFVIPEIVPESLGTWMKSGMPMPEFWSAVLSLGFYTASRVAEQVRSGIQSIPRDQVNAALAMGLTRPQVYRHVLLPMAYRIMLPPLTSEFLNIIKNSAVALTIGLMELTARARAMQEFSFQVFEAFTAATLIYIAINIVVTFAMRRLERAVAVPGYIGSAPRPLTS